MEIIVDAFLDALIDGVKMLPFLYLAYLLIEWLERNHGERIEKALAGGGHWGFVPGALLGCVPQCGFSAVAANFYASRVITPGTLLAVFMAVNLVTSALALARYDARTSGAAPANAVDVLLDEHFDNARMERIYPNAKKVEKAG